MTRNKTATGRLILAAALALSAALAVTGCASQAPAPADSSTATPVAQSAVSSPAPGLAASSSPPAGGLFQSPCTLGYLAGYEGSGPGMEFYAGGGFYPDTAAGESDASHISAGFTDGSYLGVDPGFEVTFTNYAPGGVRFTGYIVTVNYQGSVIESETATTGPVFLGPGESSQTYITDLAQVSGATAISDQVYQQASCSVTGLL